MNFNLQIPLTVTLDLINHLNSCHDENKMIPINSIVDDSTNPSDLDENDNGIPESKNEKNGSDIECRRRTSEAKKQNEHVFISESVPKVNILFLVYNLTIGKN